MKKILIALAALAATTSAHATGLQRTIYDCRGGAGESAASFRVDVMSMSPPGGPIRTSYFASAGSSWFNGTHASGNVGVQLIAAQDGGPLHFINREAGFSLSVLRQRPIGPAGRSTAVLVEATFKDPRTGMAGQITRRWMSCR